MATDLNLRKFLLPSWDRQESHSTDFTPLHLSVRWSCPEFMKGTDVRDVCLKYTLYDAVYRQFIGRTVTLPVNIKSHKEKVMCDQDIYLISTFNNVSIIVCVEVVVNSSMPGSPPIQEHGISQGWTIFRIFDRNELMKERRGFRAVNVYQGTPRALLLMEEPIEKNPLLQQAANRLKINFAVEVHKPLLKVQHLIPKNILLSSIDRIPGIRDDLPRGLEGDSFTKPKQQRRTTLYLDHLNLILYPNVQEFDDLLLSSLKEEQLAVMKPNSNLDYAIVERRLKIGVHNGWCYLKPPQIIHLVTGHKKVSSDLKGVTRSERSRSWSPNAKKISDATTLMCHNRIKFDEISEDVEFTVVFLLEYVISVPHQSFADKQLVFPDIQSGTIAIALATWKPFTTADQLELRLKLCGGSLMNPGRQLVYRGLQQHENNCELKFRCTWGKKRSASISTLASGDISHVSRPSASEKVPYDVTSEQRRSSIVHRGNSPASELPKEYHHRDSHPGSSWFESSSVRAKRESPLTRKDSNAHNVEFLEEIPSLPGHHLSVIPRSASTFRGGEPISRATYARLYSLGLPPVLDRHGRPPEIIDPKQPFLFSVQKEKKDMMKCNLISFQFLGYSRLVIHGLLHPKTVFFTFQFYHFPLYVTERLSLGTTNVELASDSHYTTFVLKRLQSNTLSEKCPTGYEVKYCMDPTLAGCEDPTSIAHLLKDMALHIDMWDGDSLMYIGSTAVELKYLCRQGREAVQITFELDIVSMNHTEDDFDGTSVTSECVLKGRLILRLANVGFPFFPAEQPVSDAVIMPLPVIRSNVLTGKTTVHQVHKDQHTTYAKSLFDVNCNLAKELEDAACVEALVSTEEHEKKSAERLRKLARMHLVREKKDNPEVIHSKVKEKTSLTAYLRLVDALREKTKADAIRNLLLQSIAIQLEMQSAIGSAKYFEFQLVNPSKEEQMITIDTSDQDLRVVVDPDEVRHYKIVNYLLKSSLAEETIFVSERDTGLPQIFMKPKEKLMLLFRYQTFDASSFVQSEMNLFSETGHKAGSYSFENAQTWPSKLIEVHFRGSKREILSALHLRVILQSPAVDQVFRFQHLENSFLRKFIRLVAKAPLNVSLNEKDKHATVVKVTDPSVLIEVRPNINKPVDVLLKVACGSATSIRMFYVFIFCDPFDSQPMQTWRITVQSLRRIDVSCIQGQSVHHSIVVRGSHVTRLVKCYSSEPEEMIVIPEEPFLLEAGTIHDIQLQITSAIVGRRFMYCTLVDTELHQLLDSWMICLKCNPPVVSRSFQIRLPVRGGHGSNKRISYTNPYNHLKTFRLKTDRPDLLRFREAVFKIGAKATYIIGLIFPPCGTLGTVNIMVFIENEENKLEETFLIKTLYV